MQLFARSGSRRTHGANGERAHGGWDSWRLANWWTRCGVREHVSEKPAAASAPKVRRIAVNEIGYRIGTSHPNCKLSDAAIDLILELREAGLSYGAIAAKFDDPDEPTVSKSMVYKVCQGLVRCQAIARIKTVIDDTEADLSAWFEIGAGEDIALMFEMGAGEAAPVRKSWPAQAPARHSWGQRSAP